MKRKLSLIDPDLLDKNNFNNSNFFNILKNLMENDYHAYKIVLHPSYNILFYSRNNILKNEDNNIKNLYKIFLEKKFTMDDFLYHLYENDNYIQYIYPNYFTKKYIEDMNKSTIDILFEYSP